MSNSGSPHVDSTSFSSDRKQTSSVAQDILYQKNPSKNMTDSASLRSYSSTASTLKGMLKPSSWKKKKEEARDEAPKTKSPRRNDEFKWPLLPPMPPQRSNL